MLVTHLSHTQGLCTTRNRSRPMDNPTFGGTDLPFPAQRRAHGSHSSESRHHEPNPFTLHRYAPPTFYQMKRMIYVPDPTRHLSSSSVASRHVGWHNFCISKKEYAKVKKLLGLAWFKRKPSKEASPQYPHEVLMHEWVSSRPLFMRANY